MRLSSRVLLVAALAAGPCVAATAQPVKVDLVTLGVPDLDHAITRLESLTGVRPAYGGVHPTRGTHNAVLSLGDRVYLELLAARRGSEVPENADLRALKRPKVLWWGLGVPDAERARDELRRRSLETTAPVAGSRVTPSGETLRWWTFNLTTPAERAPFFIAWSADSGHPAQKAPAGCELEELNVGTARPRILAELLGTLDVEPSARAVAGDRVTAAIRCGDRRVVIPDDLEAPGSVRKGRSHVDGTQGASRR